MYSVLILVLIFFTYLEFYLNKDDSIRKLLTVTVSFIFFIILGFNSFSPDLDLYRLHYEDIDQEYIKLSIEPFIYYFMTACKNIGLSFEGYQLVFSALIFTLFSYSIYKYSPLPVFVFLSFFFIPFFPDIAQIRFFLGYVIFLFSLQFLENRKFLFYGLFVVAVLCHYSVAVMLFFVIFRNFKFFKNQTKSNWIIIIGTCFLFLIPKEVSAPLLYFLNPKYLMYLDSDSETVGSFLGTFVLFVPFFILNNIVLWHYNTKYTGIGVSENYSKHIPLFIDLIQFSNYIIFFQYFIRDFSRITQNGLIIVSIYFTIIIYSLKAEEKIFTAKLVALSVFLGIIFVYYTQFLMVNNFEYFEVINETFTSNHLFNSIGLFFEELWTNVLAG